MTCHRTFATVATVLLFAAPVAAPLAAQSVTQLAALQYVAPVVEQAPVAAPATLTPAGTITSPLPPRPVRSDSRLTLRTNAAPADLAPAASPAPRSRAVTLMIVGGATMVVGSVVDGDAGSILMIGGAVIGLVGLWRYLN